MTAILRRFFKWLIPRREFSLVSGLGAAVALERLGGSVGPRKFFRMPWDRAHVFEGRVTGRDFEINRILGYRNSFVPQLRGSIEPLAVGVGVKVRGTMTVDLSVKIFMALWLLPVGLACLCTLPFAVATRPFEPALLVPWVMFLFGVALMTGSFLLEANRSLAALCELLDSSHSELRS